MRSLVILLLLAASAGATEPTPVHDGDRIFAILEKSGGEVAFTIEGLRGTELSLKARGRAPGVEPEILIGGPDGHEILPLGYLRQEPGTGKAKLKRFPLADSGIHTVIVRNAGPTDGEVKIKVRAEHPTRVKFEGQVRTPDIPTAVGFPGFAETRARYTIRGREGFLPRIATLVAPGFEEMESGIASSTGDELKSDWLTCPTLGDYRLEILGVDDATGRFRAKVKLRHPETSGRRLQLTGSPAGTFSSAVLPPWNTTGGSGPGGGNEEPTPIPAQVVAVGSGFRLILSILPPYPDQNAPTVWPRTGSIPFEIKLESTTDAATTIAFGSGYYALAITRVSDGLPIYANPPWLTIPHPPLAFSPGQTLTWPEPWSIPEYEQWIGPVAPGLYRAEAILNTTDPRVPKRVSMPFVVR